jgi:2-aminoethylphosphonate transport system permease protein
MTQVAAAPPELSIAATPPLPSDTGRRRGKRAGRALGWVGPPLVVLGLSFVYPLVLLARRSFSPSTGTGWTISQYDELVHSSVFLHSLVTTIEISGTAAVGCVVFGLILSISLSFVAFRGGGVIGRLIDMIIAFPSFLIVLAFIFLYGSTGAVNVGIQHLLGLSHPPITFLYSPVGSICAEIVYYTPFVIRPMLAAYSQMDDHLIEAAASLGARPWRVIARVILPYGIPSLLAGGSLALVLTVNEFGINLFLGAKSVMTLPLLIYSEAILQSNLPAAAAVALVNAVLSFGLYAVYRMLVARVGRARLV